MTGDTRLERRRPAGSGVVGGESPAGAAAPLAAMGHPELKLPEIRLPGLAPDDAVASAALSAPLR